MAIGSPDDDDGAGLAPAENEPDPDEGEGGEGAEPEGEEPDAEEEEAEPEPGPDEVEEPERRVAQPKQRARDRIQSLQRENRELKAKLAAPPTPQFDAAAAQRAREQQDAAEREEEERVNLSGDIVQIARFHRDQERRRNDARYGALQFQTLDAADKSAFAVECARNPALDAVRDDAEALIASERAQGRPGPTRINAATFILGQRYLARAPRAKGKQVRRAETERVRQTGRPGAAASDAQRPGGRGADRERAARNKRVEEYTF